MTINVPGDLGDQQVHDHRRDRRLLVQQLLDPAQRSAQGFCIGPGPAHRQRGLELHSNGIRYHLQRFRGIALHSAALHVAR